MIVLLSVPLELLLLAGWLAEAGYLHLQKSGEKSSILFYSILFFIKCHVSARVVVTVSTVAVQAF